MNHTHTQTHIMNISKGFIMLQFAMRVKIVLQIQLKNLEQKQKENKR